MTVESSTSSVPAACPLCPAGITECPTWSHARESTHLAQCAVGAHVLLNTQSCRCGCSTTAAGSALFTVMQNEALPAALQHAHGSGNRAYVEQGSCMAAAATGGAVASNKGRRQGLPRWLRGGRGGGDHDGNRQRESQPLPRTCKSGHSTHQFANLNMMLDVYGWGPASALCAVL